MKCDKYMGLDVHQATTVVAVKDAEGKLILETIVPTEAAAMQRLVGSDLLFLVCQFLCQFGGL